MRTVFFSKKPQLLLRLPAFAAKGARALEAEPLDELRSSLPRLAGAALVYLDVRGLTERERSKALASLAGQPGVAFGVYDPTGLMKDPAAAFHAGAVDYLGKGVPLEALGAKRRAAIDAYAERLGVGQPEADEEEAEEEASSTAADAWADVTPGREHRFALLYVEVDGSEEMKKRYEPENLSAAMNTFRAYIEGIARPHGGRLWMWSRFGGLVLFPLGDGRCQAAVCCLKIMLSSILYDMEESPLPGRLCFRLALSVGHTVYREGDTGRIVSDAINSIFHLGQRCAKPGQCVCTAEAVDLAPPQLRPLFVPSGQFEGKRVLRMLRPSPFAAAREDGGAWRG
jgi:class 3 adenylate cyclase